MKARWGVLRSATIAGAAVWLSCAAAGRAAAEPTPPVGTIHTIDLPGGVEGIRRAVGDRRTTPPATIGVEITRRFHNATSSVTSDDPALARLRVWLRGCAREPTCGAPDLPPDRVPLPGDAAFWRAAAFDARVPAAQLMPAILERRDTAFLYAALLSAREDVRAWLLARPALVKGLLPGDAGALVVAAPYLRLDDGRWQLPGGAAAAPVWARLAGVAPANADAFLPALLRAHGGLLTYLLEVVATLSPEQQARLFPGSVDEHRRVAAGVELLDGVRAAARAWPIHERPFSRPSRDPAFLLAQLRLEADGALALPGGRAFWALVFADGPFGPRDDEARSAWRDPIRVSPGWLVARVWAPAAAEQTIRYEQVLFAARRLAGAEASQAAAAATVLRGYQRYPQLLRVLDRLEVDDVARLAALVRRADALAQAGADWRSRAALVRWQAELAILDGMARLGSLACDDRDRALDALADPGDALASRGARLRALGSALGLGAIAGDVRGRAVEQALIARITRTGRDAGRGVTWEGQAYRLDFGAAERDRLARVRGRDGLPRLDAAWAVLALADHTTRLDAAAALAALAGVVTATRLERPLVADDALDREARTAAATARRLLDAAAAGRVGPEAAAALDDLGEALATAGIAELAYAMAMGWAEDLPLTALAAFRRHVFSEPPPAGTPGAFWQPPTVIAARGEPWHVAGSLLGLDDALAPVTLRRPSMRPLGAAPSLNTGDRRWLVSTAAAFDRRPFTDAAQAALVAAAARGQARLAAIHGAAAAREAAEQAGASSLRQTLAGWLAAVDPGAVAGVFSLTEILRLGSYPEPLPDGLAGWGAVQAPVSGRLAPGPLPSLPWERYAGRSARLVSCALPDLQLTLAVRLAELGLPAVLVPDLMPSATFELVNTATPRHADDFDALAERVRLVDRDAVERYLGLLTVSGPLRAEPESRTP